MYHLDICQTVSSTEKLLTQCDKGHDEDLGALSKEHRQQHSLPGRTENIPMHLLPSGLFLCILLGDKGQQKSQGNE